MAKLYFRYGAMSSGKSEQLVSIAMNYKVQGKRVVVFSPTADTRASASSGVVKSRNGAEWPSIRVSPEANLHSEFLTATKTDENRPVCVLVDEAQFLTREQVMSLTKIVDAEQVPVIAFGLKADFRVIGRKPRVLQPRDISPSSAELSFRPSLGLLTTYNDCGILLPHTKSGG